MSHNPHEIERTIQLDGGVELHLHIVLTKEERERIVADYAHSLHARSFVPLSTGSPELVHIPKGATIKPKERTE